MTGFAKERPESRYFYGGYGGLNPFSPWGRWYPWYGGSFGYGFVSYDPWRYGNSRYSLYRYGSWYNPYDPYCAGGFYWPCNTYAASGGGSGDMESSEATGSLRLRVSPAHAEVFVDGALVGTVDDFNGLRNHLKLTLGEHMVEIRAEGYETFVPEFTVYEGKTSTVRGSLKKVVR